MELVRWRAMSYNRASFKRNKPLRVSPARRETVNGRTRCGGKVEDRALVEMRCAFGRKKEQAGMRLRARVYNTAFAQDSVPRREGRVRQIPYYWMITSYSPVPIRESGAIRRTRRWGAGECQSQGGTQGREMSGLALVYNSGDLRPGAPMLVFASRRAITAGSLGA